MKIYFWVWERGLLSRLASCIDLAEDYSSDDKDEDRIAEQLYAQMMGWA